MPSSCLQGEVALVSQLQAKEMVAQLQAVAGLTQLAHRLDEEMGDIGGIVNALMDCAKNPKVSSPNLAVIHC